MLLVCGVQGRWSLSRHGGRLYIAYTGPQEFVDTWKKLGKCAYDPLPVKELENFFYAVRHTTRL